MGRGYSLCAPCEQPSYLLLLSLLFFLMQNKNTPASQNGGGLYVPVLTETLLRLPGRIWRGEGGGEAHTPHLWQGSHLVQYEAHEVGSHPSTPCVKLIQDPPHRARSGHGCAAPACCTLVTLHGVCVGTRCSGCQSHRLNCGVRWQPKRPAFLLKPEFRA